MFDYDIIFECSENNVVAHTTSYELNKVSIENWEMNRPPYMPRIPEIQSSIKNQSYVDGIIYLSMNKTGDGYICYDGIHRLTALKTLRADKDVVIDLLLSYSEDQIVSKFWRVNKCQPVPTLYTTEQGNIKMREVIEKVVHFIQSTHPRLFSPSITPNIPNENRDVFMNKLTNDILERTNKVNKESTYEDWIKYLHSLNEFVRDNIIDLAPKLTASQGIKCNNSKWYLFAVKNWQITVIDRFELINV